MSGILQAMVGSGDKRVIDLTISADTNNYNIYTAAGSPADPVEVRVTVNGSVVVGSTSTGSYAMDTGTGWSTGTKLKLTNNGVIVGKGGTGGNGAVPYSSAATAGTAAGPAFNAQYAIEITNNSSIGGGGGGAGGGGGQFSNGEIDSYPSNYCGECTLDIAMGGGGGGAGQGATASSGGSHGGCGFCNTEPTNGGSSSSSSAGSPGGAAYWVNNCGGGEEYYSGAGGTGGSLGSAGGSGGNCWDNDGCAAACTYSGAGGGAAGACTNGNSNITWIATGNRYGALN